MDCYHCKTELIWGGDHDCEDDEDYAIVTNLSCPKCQSLVIVYWSWGESEKGNKSETCSDNIRTTRNRDDHQSTEDC